MEVKEIVNPQLQTISYMYMHEWIIYMNEWYLLSFTPIKYLLSLF